MEKRFYSPTFGGNAALNKGHAFPALLQSFSEPLKAYVRWDSSEGGKNL